MRLWNIPLFQRVIKTDASFCAKVKVMELDGVGFVYRYNNKKELDPAFIRRIIHWREGTKCLVEAETVTQAINQFFAEWEGANVGGNKREEQKALWIDREQEIYEIPLCPTLAKNRRGEYTCGPPKANGNGEFGMCVVMDYDAPEDCAIARYWDNVRSLDKVGRLPVRTIIIRGREYKYVMAKDIFDISKTL